jgi:hypothetical protein
MTFQGDPYRILGLAPGASANEIRSAYRRMAKRYHPDAAGERALPRFLAIQAAYEALVDANGDLRRGAGASRQAPGSRGAAWRADPSRARASRDAWRARGRSGAASKADAEGESAAEGEPTAGDPSGGQSRPGAAGTTASGRERRAPGGQAEHHFRRHRRTATPGSTTYDEAAETPLDPAWDGGTWYGASSGTYWTLNPREYADPRKHGPEYRRRAWRAAGLRGTPPHGSGEQATPSPEPSESASPSPGAAPRPSPRAMPDPSLDPARPRPDGRSGVSRLLGTLLPEQLLVLAHRDGRARAILSVVASVPVPWVAGIVLAGVAGCAAGGCPPLVAGLALAAWALAALVAAMVPAGATLGTFAVLVAGAGSLVSGLVAAIVTGDPGGAVVQAAGSLGVVLYCFALVIGGARLYGRREEGAPGP